MNFLSVQFDKFVKNCIVFIDLQIFLTVQRLMATLNLFISFIVALYLMSLINTIKFYLKLLSFMIFINFPRLNRLFKNLLLSDIQLETDKLNISLTESTKNLHSLL